MPTESSCFRGRLSSIALWIPATLAVALCVSQLACGNLKKVVGNASEEAKPVRRRTWSVAIQTTGTVDWDADHTTQAITQVNGPISRIMVDLGSTVKAGDPL